MRPIQRIALAVAALVSLVACGLASAQDLHTGVTYVCNGERLLIESCNMRDTSDTSSCLVQHPDRPQHNGFPAYTNETRGTLKTLLPTCKQPGAAQIARADSARKNVQDKQDAAFAKALAPTPDPTAAPTTMSRDKLRTQRCLSAGRTEMQCAGSAFGNFFADAINLAGSLIGAEKPETGLYFAGRYEGKGWRIDFTPGVAEMYCSDLVTAAHPYKIEFQGTRVALHLENDPQALTFSWRDGKLYGPSQAVQVAGRIVVGTTAGGGGGSYPANTPTSSMPTTTTQTTTRDMSPLEADAYVRGGGTGSVQQSGASYTVTESTTTTEFHATPAPQVNWNSGPQVITAPRTRSCPAPLLTNTPERESEDMGSALTSIAGMFGGSDDAPTKKSPPPLAPVGLRMTGEFEVPGGADIEFRDNSAIVACGLIAAEYPYAVDLSGDHPVLRLAGQGKQPIELTFGEKNTLTGSGDVQVTGRLILGEGQNGEMIAMPKTAKCSLGKFSAVTDNGPVSVTPAPVSGTPTTTSATTASGGATATSSSNAHPNFATAAKPLGNAVLTIKSGFPAQSNTPDPLGSSAFMLMRNPVAVVIAKSGAPVPTHISAQEAIHSACEANKPECGKYLTAVTNDAAAGAKAGPHGATVLPGVPPGTYYLSTSAKIGQLMMYWHVKLDLKAGANAITLDTHNAEPIK